MTRRTISIALILAASACGSDEGNGKGGAGSSGAGGAAGAAAGAGGSGKAGSAGAAGATGTSGGAGTGGTSGTGGAAGTGGTSGSSGAGGGAGTVSLGCSPVTECELVDNCCDCLAIPKGTKPPPCGQQTCLVSACERFGVSPEDARCIAGACSLGVDCDTTKVTCEVVEPQCDPGQVPTVDSSGLCYGGCIDATQCRSVPACDRCDSASQLCVSEEAFTSTMHCIPVPAPCANDRTCSCLGSMLCVPPFDACSDGSGPNEIRCSCPAC